MDIKSIIEAVDHWQTSGEFHPLTCGNDSRHGLLYAAEQAGKVVLRCPDCDYVQTYIPEAVMGHFGARRLP